MLEPQKILEMIDDQLKQSVQAIFAKFVKGEFLNEKLKKLLESGYFYKRILQSVERTIAKMIYEADHDIIRIVEVKRSSKPLESLKKSGFKINKDKEVDAMPSNGIGTEEVEVVLFQHKFISNGDFDELQAEFDERGLTCDPYALIQLNLDDPEFVKTHSSGTQWKNSQDYWCYIEFSLENQRKEVNIGLNFSGWMYPDRWYAGVRKPLTNVNQTPSA